MKLTLHGVIKATFDAGREGQAWQTAKQLLEGLMHRPSRVRFVTEQKTAELEPCRRHHEELDGHGIQLKNEDLANRVKDWQSRIGIDAARQTITFTRAQPAKASVGRDVHVIAGEKT